MERELWKELYRIARELDISRRRGWYRAWEILAVYFWAVVHDRPVLWACCEQSWPSDVEFDRPIPSQPTMSRRLRTTAVEQLLLAIEAQISDAVWTYVVWIKVIDAKPLPVGVYSKDPDAAWGPGAGGKQQKGYKFYAIWEQHPLPVAWGLGPMNVAETEMGKALVDNLPGSGYLLGDKLYDSNRLFDAVGKNNHQLVAPQQRPGKALGHRQHSPFRLRSFELLKTDFGRSLFKQRNQIERCFGNWTSFGSGLAPLPAWVRRFPRVRLWVHAKLLINALRIQRLHPENMLATA
jgi:transposase